MADEPAEKATADGVEVAVEEQPQVARDEEQGDEEQEEQQQLHEPAEKATADGVEVAVEEQPQVARDEEQGDEEEQQQLHEPAEKATADGVEVAVEKQPQVARDEEQGYEEQEEQQQLHDAIAVEESSSFTKPPRQWAIDRSNGESKIGDSRPPIFLCYAPPCVKWCPSFFEMNPCCIFSGRIGVIDPDTNQKGRTILMSIGIVTHCIGFILTILSCLAISTDFDIVRQFSYSSGRVTDRDQNLIQDILIDVGLRSISFENNNVFGNITSLQFGLDNVNGVGKVSINFDDICGFVDNGLERYMDPVDCNNCADVSSSLVSTLIMSCIFYIFMIAANVQRMYPNYDVNCQKTAGSFINLVSFGLSMSTWRNYMDNCFQAFFNGIKAYDVNGTLVTSVDSPDTFIVVNFDWKGGAGLVLIIIATFLKVVDVICHLLLPTPSITRNRQEQVEYEKLQQQQQQQQQQEQQQHQQEQQQQQQEQQKQQQKPKEQQQQQQQEA